MGRMKKLGVFEAKTHFSALIKAAKSGETIIITKNGEAVAQIGPIGSRKTATTAADAMKRILSSKAKLGPGGIRQLIDEGRRY